MGLFTKRRAVAGLTTVEADGWPTHVLEWSPSGALAAWYLRTTAGYESGEYQSIAFTQDLPRDAKPEELAVWAAGRLGHLVVVTPATHQVKARPTARHRAEPIFLVWPASLHGGAR